MPEAPAPPAPRERAPEPASGDLVIVAIPDEELGKRVVDALRARGLRGALARDGVEAMLEIQRQLPRAVVLAAHLPKMFGFQVCEVVKRNESLRGTWVVLVGAIHHPDRYRREPNELYGADAYLEAPDLPDGLFPLLERGGLACAPAAPARPAAPVAPPRPEPVAPPRAASREAAPPAAPAAAPAPKLAAPAPAPAPPRTPPAPGLEEARAKAERLARIIVSDIVLYNEEKFSRAVRQRNVLEALAPDLVEGRALFEERIDARVRAERDYLADELLRVAKQRGMG
jgi:CheY-like chemotaxis protein